MSAHPILPSGYGDWLKSLKSLIASARQRAALAVNQELVTLYHSIGKDILQRQASEGWGAKVIQRLSSASAMKPMSPISSLPNCALDSPFAAD